MFLWLSGNLADWPPIRLTLSGVHSSVLHSLFGQGFDSACCPRIPRLAALWVSLFAGRAFGDGYKWFGSEFIWESHSKTP